MDESQVIRLNSDSTHDPVTILKFWHCIEFFTPFDLNEACSSPNAKYQLTENQLMEQHGNIHLPWLSELAFNKAGCITPYKYRYNLYLLPFNKNELTKISQKVFPLDQTGIKNLEFEEKFNDEGKTCFAQLPLDSKGRPAWDKISISTLPFALGKLSDYKIHDLNYKYYKEEQQKLEVELRLLSLHINDGNSEIIKDKVLIEDDGSFVPGALTAHGLLALFVILRRWSKFSPDHPIVVVIEHIKMSPNAIKENSFKPSSNQLTNQKKLNVMLDDLKEKMFDSSKKEIGENLVEKEKLSGHKEDIEEKKESEEYSEKSGKVVDIDLSERGSILNSFYIEDLENVINDITKNYHKLLSPYILGIDKEQKIDLHVKKNHSYIIQKLRPSCINQGRWPVDDRHFMSMMQQFVINEHFDSINKDHLLLSVNGPPGTGKTTLFQDIVAENITRRARILSEFASSGDAFTDSISVNFTNKGNITINLLNKKLLGFEMLVVSSNNQAVENISKEFPLKRKIFEKYQENISYLRPVASKVFSVHKNNEIIPLQPEDTPWGLIAIALGNSKNRNQFNERVFFAPENKKMVEIRVKRGTNLSIWEWRKQYNGATFQQAKREFIEVDQTLHNYLDIIKRCEQLHNKVGNIDLDNYCLEYYSKLESLKLAKEKLETHSNEFLENLATTAQEKFLVSNNIDQHIKIKPSLYQRIFYRKIVKSYTDQRNKLTLDLNNLLDQERILKEKNKEIISQLKKVLDETNKVLQLVNIKENEYKKYKNEYDSLLELLPGIILSPANGKIENATQLQAFWQNEKLNELRVNLFAAALKLHEAWLAEVLKNGKFNGNLHAISNLLSNKRLVNTENEIYIWQSLFIWIPVISSTFASISRQFKNINSKAFGCFLIDEAGQAIPQAAVGAIWRAKKALIVGDPLQIEPVFTAPPNLIEGLARHLLQEQYEKWLPTLTSVQILADEANIWGAYTNIADQQQWVGCPLRVHRRCLDPMFSVANQIAYDDKMINVRMNNTLLKGNYYLGNSCWYHLKGEATDKQYVQAQGELLLNLFVQLYENEQQLPKLYIITPFKRIKYKLQELIGNSNNWSRYLNTTFFKPTNKHVLKTWCTENIGTVHTFQGKEANSVIFILGADEKTLGAINWASSKPNLLNVALTRAKDRIYIIGDYDLWSRKRYFSELSQSLPTVNVPYQVT